MVYIIEDDYRLKRAPDIEEMQPFWKQVSIIVEGGKAVRKAGREFLPQFPDEKAEQYELRLKNSKFTNIFRDISEGLASKPFEKDITVEDSILEDGDKKNNTIPVPKEISDFIKDVDGEGNNLTNFAGDVFFNGIVYGIHWIFVDFPESTDELLSVADAKEKNLKPYWFNILGKNVLEVRRDASKSKKRIVYFRYQEPSFDEENKKIREYILERDEKGEERVKYEVFKVEKDEYGIEKTVSENSGYMSISYIPVVPFITGRRDGTSFKIHPPMEDAADLQEVLYRNESQLEYIKMLAGYPMLSTNGTKKPVGKDGKTIEKTKIGPGRILYGIPDDAGNGGNWKYLEPNANTMEFLKKDAEGMKTDLRELGRQPLTALSTQLTTTTTAIAAGKAKSAVSVWTLTLENVLSQCLKITMDWMNITQTKYEPTVVVYRGFDNVLDSSTDVQVLEFAVENNFISIETFLDEMKRRKILSPTFNKYNDTQKLLNQKSFDEDESEEITDILS